MCTQRFYYSSPLPSLEGQSDGPLSPSDIHPSSNPKQLMLSGVSLLAVSNVNNPVGLVGLPYVMWSAHFCHTHTDGKDKLLEWPDRSCLLLYVSARIH